MENFQENYIAEEEKKDGPALPEDLEISRKEKRRIEELERIIKEAYKTDELLNEAERKRKNLEAVSAFLDVAEGKEKIENARKVYEVLIEAMTKESLVEDKARVHIKEIELKNEVKLTREQIEDKIIYVADRPEEFEKEEIGKKFAEIPIEFKTIVAEQHIERGRIDVVVKNIKKYPEQSLSPLVREALENAGEKEVIEKNSDKFQVAGELAGKKSEESGEKDYDKLLEKVDHLDNQTALEMIREEKGLALVAKYLKKFSDLNYEIAVKLIVAGKNRETADGINSFRSEWHKDIALRIIDNGGVEDVLENHERFSTINYDKLIPDYPRETKLSDLLEIYKWPGLGGLKIVSALRGLKDFSFREHILPIIKAQKGVAHLFFKTIKKFFGEKFLKKDINAVMFIAEKNYLHGAEVLAQEMG